MRLTIIFLLKRADTMAVDSAAPSSIFWKIMNPENFWLSEAFLEKKLSVGHLVTAK
jgi:hypothetical protein